MHVARRRVAGILLAGGRSTRMGRDKAFMEFAGAPMVAWCAAALAECAPSLFVSSSSAAHAMACARAVEGAWPRFTVLRGVRVLTAIDSPGQEGPLAGLAAGLGAADAEHVVVSACDTPLVPPEFYRRAVALLDGCDAVAASIGGTQPLLSAWRRPEALKAAQALEGTGKGPRGLLELLRSRLVDEGELVAWGLDPRRFAAANTRFEHERLEALAGA